MKTTQRVETDSSVVTIETIVTERSKFVDYADIRAAVTIEPDDWPDAPWESCDGWEHSADKFDDWSHEGLRDSVGYASRNWRDPSVVITLCDDLDAEYQFYRLNGLSKQVSFERVAQIKRERIEQLVRWYSNGWEVWYVCGEYEGYEGDGGLSGVYDDDGDYVEECARDLADSIADEMEDDGYVVTDRPERSNPDNRRSYQHWLSDINVTTGRDLINRRYRRHIQDKRDQAVERAQSL